MLKQIVAKLMRVADTEIGHDLENMGRRRRGGGEGAL
jgi:metal-sulfur cluster biosynthetic enzyme